MAAVGCRRPPWSVSTWFTYFYRYITCHVSAVQKILSMERPFFSQYAGLRRIWYKKTFASCILPKETHSKKYDQLYLHKEDTSNKNVKCNEIGEYEQNIIECSNKFVRPTLTELEICFPVLMQLLVCPQGFSFLPYEQVLKRVLTVKSLIHVHFMLNSQRYNIPQTPPPKNVERGIYEYVDHLRYIR